MAANGISTLATKELKQKAKLDLAALDRAAVGNDRATYDITLLPTQYDNNAVIDNPNIGGLVAGRPWIETVSSFTFYEAFGTTTAISVTRYVSGNKIYAESSTYDVPSFQPARVVVNDIEVVDTELRGHTLVVLDSYGNVVTGPTQYDTWVDPANLTTLASALNSVASGNIVVLVVYDASALNAGVRSAINTGYGSTNSNTWTANRNSHIFIGIKGTTVAFANPTLTIGSAVSTVAQSPFAGGGNSYSFSSSVNSFIDTPASNDWAVGTGDFTIEWFSYQTSLSGFQRAFTVDDFASIDIGSSIESGTFYYWANDAFRYNSSSASTANTWIHWAIVRASGVTRVYRNGTQLGSQITDTNNITNTVDQLTIGNENTATTLAAFVGYITNFRWVKGLAVYTGNFTVPTSTLTATAAANPYGGSNTAVIPGGVTKLLLVP
jgi:hypothetical protein